MNNHLQNILYKKYQEKGLASLYAANYDSRSIDPNLWVKEFLHLLTPLEDHPDVLKIIKTPKESEYKIDSKGISEFFNFINYRPLQLKMKFIFLFDAQDISVILCNKLLKVFEEMGSNYCLFLMIPDNAFMLPTVMSRAIKLQIPNTQNMPSSKVDFSAIKTPQDLLAFFKENGDNDKQLEKKFIEEIIDRCLTQSTPSIESFMKLDELLKIISDNELFANFNNSKLSRMTRFFS